MTQRATRAVMDRRELPAYGPLEAARYLGISASTIRYWAAGRQARYPGLIEPAQARPLLLSFRNLVELHVLGAMRRTHEISLPNVRKALRYVSRQFHVRHPLVAAQFQTDGVNLFLERYGQLVNVSRDGQLVMREALEASLTRIERDTRGIPVKLYPYTRNELQDAPRVVVIDPTVSFGRPVIAGTGLATEVIAERYKAGESIEDLAADYARSAQEIQEAVRCELHLAA